MIIAYCSRCRREKEFSANAGRKNGRGVYCKDCQREHQHNWYLRHKKAQIGRVASRHKRIQGLVRQAKNRPCKDCGGVFPACCMDFDHVKGLKKFGLSNAHRRFSIEKIEQEIKKCEVVCSNCHRIRTERRLGSSTG